MSLRPDFWGFIILSMATPTNQLTPRRPEKCSSFCLIGGHCHLTIFDHFWNDPTQGPLGWSLMSHTWQLDPYHILINF